MRKLKNTLTILIFILFVTNLHAQNLDNRLLQAINGPPASADGFWHGVANSDYGFVMATPASMLIVGLAKHDQVLKIKAFETGGAVLLAEGSSVLLKNLIHRQRPFVAHPELFYGKSSPTDYSFPSGHTSTAFATATSLSLAFPKWYVIAPSFAYASAVGYSRMYLGVHYPSDVLAGAAVGIGSAFLSFKLQHFLARKIH
ncbi:phosphatase PAP2 family protein [Mucilaginibacter segetis]|uniref:Phosphatase PAP2 family protein n=1 Tax=Mucilaginibacter segetis TaxID=2793071 RepID=A0A934PPT8_9SPHI|nr:phosphatase PAP2 family protein [Mucilaginibacter segetis]MBK0378514.1 phosphatase PAP2 family protein [Mucilaginibacter segetis]